MKKKVGLITLFMTGAATFTLASCGNQQVQDNADSISELQTKIAALESQLSSTKTSLTETIQTSISDLRTELTAVNTETIATLTEAIAKLNAEGTEKSTTSIERINTEITNIQGDVTDLEEALRVNLETLNANIETLEQNSATKEELNAAKAALEDTLATKEALNDVNTDLQAKLADLEARMKAGSVTGDDLKEATDELKAADAAIQAIVDDHEERIKAIEDTYAKTSDVNSAVSQINTSIETLEKNLTDSLNDLSETTDAALATVNKTLEDHATAIADINGKVSTFQTVITQLNNDLESKVNKASYDLAIQELKDVDKAAASSLSVLSDKATALDARITALEAKTEAIDAELTNINTLIGSISEDDDSTDSIFARIYAINAQIAGLKGDNDTFLETFEDFYGDNVKSVKTGYVYDLAMSYANYRKEMTSLNKSLVDLFGETEEIKGVYNGMMEAFDYEMTAYMNEGIAEIILAKNAEEAETAFNTYKDRLESYTYEAQFLVQKGTLAATIDNATYMPEATKTQLATDIEAVNYDPETDLDEDYTLEDLVEYYEDKSATLKLLSAKTSNIESIYTTLSNTIAELDTLAEIKDTSYINTFTAAFKSKVSADAYYAKTTIAEVNALKTEDDSELKVCAAQAISFNKILALVSATNAKVDELTNPTADNKKVIKQDISNVKNDEKLAQYLALTTIDDIDTLYGKDAALIAFYFNIISSYDYEVAYAADTAKQFEALPYILDENLTAVKKSVTDIPTFDEFYALTQEDDIEEFMKNMEEEINFVAAKASLFNSVLGTASAKVTAVASYALISEANQKTFTDAINAVPVWTDFVEAGTADDAQEVANTQIAEITLFDAQAKAYQTMLEYAKDKNDKVVAFGLPTLDQDVALAAINILDFAKYYNVLADDDAISAQKDADTAIIDLAFNQATAYDNLFKYSHAAIEAVNALSIADVVKTTITDAINAYLVATNYVNNELDDVEKIEAKLTEDKAAVDLLKERAVAFDTLLAYAKTKTDAIDALKNTTEDEEKAINVLINAVPESKNYLAEAITTIDGVQEQLAADKAKIDEIVAEATSYDTARAYDTAKEIVVAGLANITDDITSINALIKAVPVYDNYIGNKNHASLLETDKLAIDEYVTIAKDYSEAKTYVVTNKKTVTELKLLSDDVTDDEVTTPGEKTTINNLITAVVTYDNYFDENVEDDSATQLAADKAAIDLLVNQAKAYNEGLLYASTAVQKVTNLTNVENKEDIIAEINEVVVYDDFVENEDYVTNLANDKTEIDLLVAQEDAYAQAMNYVVTNKATVTALANVSADDKAEINDLIAEVVDFENYDGKSKEEATAQLTKDKAAIDLLVNQAKAYNTARGYEATNKTNINALETISDNDKKLALNTLALIVEYASYINNENYEKNLTSDKDATELVHAKAYTFDKLLEYMATNDALIDNLAYLTDDVTVDEVTTLGEKTKIKALIDAVATFETNYLNNEILTDTTTVNGKYEVDKSAINLYVAQATAYNDVKKHADDVYTQNIDSLGIDATVITTVEGLIYGVPKYGNYIGVIATTEAIGTKKTEDNNQIDLYSAQAVKYSEAIAYLNATKTKVNNLTKVSDTDKKEINKLLEAVFTSADYVDELESTTAIGTRYNDDKASMDAIYNKAVDYNEALAYVETMQTKLTTITWNDVSNLTSDQITAAQNKMSAVVVYANYFGEEVETTPLANNKAAVELLYNQVSAYSEIKNNCSTLLADYDELSHNLTDDYAEEETTYLNAIKAIPVFDEYLDALADTTAINNQKTNDTNALNLLYSQLTNYNEIIGKLSYYQGLIDNLTNLETIGGDAENPRSTAIKNAMAAVIDSAKYSEAKTVAEVQAKYTEDFAAIKLLYDQADAYNTVVTAALAAINTVSTEYTSITEETDVTNIKNMFNAVPQYDLYVGNLAADAITTKKTADTTAIGIILYKAQMYNATIKNSTDLVTSLTTAYANNNNAEYAKEFAHVIELVEGVPAYADYFEAGLVTTDAIQAVYDADVVEYALYEAMMVQYDTLFEAYSATNTAVAELTHLSTTETINEESTTAQEVYLAKLAEYVNYENYNAAIADMAKDAIATYVTNANKEIALLQTSAETLDEINEYLYDDTDGKIVIIKNLSNLGDELKKKFIDKLALYATYVNHMSLTPSFTTDAQFAKYLSDAKTKADSTATIASSEDQNVYEVNQAITTIETAYTNDKISEELQDYLLKVVANIYENNTNVEITSSIVAKSRQETLKTQVTTVTNSIDTFTSVDAAIAKLDDDMYEFVFAARSEFITGHDNAETATTIFTTHSAEITAKEAEIMYTYSIPESYTYADFATFKNSLKSTSQINDLIKTFQNWYVNELLPTMEAEYTAATTTE